MIAPQIKDQPGGDRPLSFGCGKLRVPLDYRDPSRKAIELFLLRVRMDGQQKRIGSLVVNPGGPGGSGVDAAVGLGLSLPTDVLKRFDLVGFDPRGVGLSAPVECISGALKDKATALDPDATTDAAYQAQVALAKEISQSCLAKYGDDLQHFNTEETARDLDLVRQGVGDAKLTYLGYSYGTRLGSVYAQLFPRNVRALVLDGAVDPKQGEVASAETQAAGFERAFDQFAADCKARNASCLIGPDPRAAVTRLLAKARTGPDPRRQRRPEGDRRARVLLAVVSALYDRGDWAELESALADAANGNSSGIFTLADRTTSGTPGPLHQPGRRQHLGELRRQRGEGAGRDGQEVAGGLADEVPAVRDHARARHARLPAVDRAARAAAGGPGRRGPAAAGDRHDQRPGHAVRVGAGAGPDPGHRRAAHRRGRDTRRTRRRRACPRRSTRT